MRSPSSVPRMLRAETKTRARALQLLYAWELQGGPPVRSVATGLARITGERDTRLLERAEGLACEVVARASALDRHAAAAADNWRLSRIATVERNILRLGIHELEGGAVPPKVAIDEAVRLAHWFAGPRAAGFVNGVLDRIAHSFGRL
jgi:N utilization substance protein B